MKLLNINSTIIVFLFLTMNLAAQTTTVSGRVLNKFSVPATNVELTLTGTNFNQTVTADSEGNYTFAEVPVNQEFTLEAIKEDDFLNGVSTFDMVVMNKHILGLTIFETPDQYIAMDANQSGSNTAFDLVQLRQLVLGITTELPNNSSWRIVATADLENADFSQGGFENTVSTFQNFTTGTTPITINFTAIKIGDANGNSIP